MKRLAAIFLVLSCLAAHAGQQDKMSHYLFAYFINNTTEGQQTCFAVSDNGLDFTPLNDGKPVVSSDTISRSGGIRDPHILRTDDGWFLMVLTDMDWQRGKWSNRGIVMMRSRDLVNWEHHTVHFPERYAGKNPAKANAVWAPQTIYDPTAGKYMVYFSLHFEADGPYPQDRVYYAYANEDFSDLETEPQVLFNYPDPTIDTDIVRDEEGVYHLFFNTWNESGLNRRQYIFTDLHDQSKWTLVPGQMQPNDIGSEGSTAYPLIEGGWVLSYDCHYAGIYQFCSIEDWRNFTLLRSTKTTGNFTPRHGSVIQISDAEYDKLLKAYPSKASNLIVNGVPWFDQDGNIVNAHGAGIIEDGGRYWLFGEYKSDTSNAFPGFGCYSSDDLVNWRFERVVMPVQKDGVLGPNRVGERPKVMRCPKTGEYVMFAHADDLGYMDPNTVVATCKTINGDYELKGTLEYHGEPIHKWDIGTFQDEDGRGYLLVHHGPIYRLSDDYLSVDTMIANVEGMGESPAMFKKNGIYYLLTSNLTSWERNDNYYFTATNIAGPWTKQGLFCPEGTLTWNSQTTSVLMLPDGTPMYMGDRWSYPHQASAATYVWLPMQVNGNDLMIPEYWEVWNPVMVQPVNLAVQHIADGWKGEKPGDTFMQLIKGGQRVAIYGTTDSQSAYGDIAIKDSKGKEVFTATIDFYSKTPATGLRWLSPQLPAGTYTLEVRVADMKPNWTDKKKTQYGSTGYEVKITSIDKMQGCEAHDDLWQSFLCPPDSIKVGCYYYWVNERVDPEGVKADLQWMKDNGITLAYLATDIRNRARWDNPWDGQVFGKNKFQSPLWWKNLRTALKTAGDLGIEMGIFNCPGWSQSGGPWVKPDEAMREWTPAGIRVCQTKQGRDVTNSPCSPEAEGLEVDKLSKTHVQKHFESFIGEILRRIPAEDRPTLTTVVVDSWERGKQNYTDSIFSLFRQRFGYELDYSQLSILNSQFKFVTLQPH